MIKILGIDKWHQNGKKEYADQTIDIVNRIIGMHKESYGNKMLTVEVGCGFGDIIGNIHSKDRCGIDINPRIVMGARIIHPSTHFMVGSFEGIKNKKVFCLIIVNILHFLEPEYVGRQIMGFLNDNNVEYVVMDELKNSPNSNYKYEYTGGRLLKGYTLFFRSKRIIASNGASRHIMVYKKQI